jgi:hypothetical protein
MESKLKGLAEEELNQLKIRMQESTTAARSTETDSGGRSF